MKKDKKQYIAPKMKWGDIELEAGLLTVSEETEVLPYPINNGEDEEEF